MLWILPLRLAIRMVSAQGYEFGVLLVGVSGRSLQPDFYGSGRHQHGVEH